MHLVSLTVENFRSITTARKIPISRTTTLIGPNNEGKSNILRALAIGMSTLLQRRPPLPRTLPRPSLTSNPARRRRRDMHVYNWASDFPLRLQEAESKKNSNITLEFALSQPEILKFREEIGSQLNGTLPIAFSFHKDGSTISIAKPGRGHKILNAKALKIAEFVAQRIEIQYIPAVRTVDAAQRIVEELVAYELSKIESDPRYVQALEDIEALQEPILQELSQSIAGTMRIFLPQISSVKLSIEFAGS